VLLGKSKNHFGTPRTSTLFFPLTRFIDGLQLRRAISIQAEGKKFLEKDAIAPSAARLCWAARFDLLACTIDKSTNKNNDLNHYFGLRALNVCNQPG
jgi:hypothetical protein